MSNLTILNTAIRQFDNLFSLNDLHRVGGGESKHKPTNFIRLDTTQELVAEIQKEDPTVIALQSNNGGVNRGTYACMEIALAYAMWIDPKFHLIVLRAYMAMKNDELQNSQQNLPLVDIEQDEEALHIIVNLFHSLNGAYDMGEKLRTQAPHLARQIDNEVGGHYIYNLHMPTKQALEKARKFVHAKSERIMFVKGMLSLLEEPKRLVHTNF